MKIKILVVAGLMVLVVGLGWNLSRSKVRQQESTTAAADTIASTTPNPTPPAFGANNPSAGNVIEPATNAVVSSSIFRRIAAGEKAIVTVPSETIHAYLQSNAFSAESLLVAFQASSNHEYLVSAARTFPHDPRVQLAVLMNPKVPGLPEERATWLARFKEDAADNTLPNYIAARDAFQARQPHVALQELLAANSKPHYRDYIVENIQAMEELYLADGRAPAEAKLAGMANVLLPHHSMLRDLGKDEVELQKHYVAAGDQRSADLMAADAARLGRQLSTDGGAVSLLSQMVGIAIETSALKEYPSDARPAFLPASARERLAELQQQRQSVRENAKFWDQWIGTANENEVIAYCDRLKLYGESGAMAWLRNRTTAAATK